MNTTAKIFIVAALFAITAGAATGGFVAGGYWTGQKMEKAAIAHDCASLDPSTLAFKWRLPISMEMTMEAMPDVLPANKPARGAK